MSHVLLYVEDEDAAFFLLEAAIKEAAIDVSLYRVATGDEAMAFLHRSGGYNTAPTPDLVLLDLNLPGKTGLEVLAEMRKTAEFNSVGVVVFSSSSLAMDKRRSLELGAREYIIKPNSFDGLVAAVKSACAYMPSNGSGTVN
jgi:chemotaxis family two-component system response regulator Rcp1